MEELRVESGRGEVRRGKVEDNGRQKEFRKMLMVLASKYLETRLGAAAPDQKPTPFRPHNLFERLFKFLLDLQMFSLSSGCWGAVFGGVLGV